MENTLKELVEEFSRTAWNEYLPHLSIDCVVFGCGAAMEKRWLLSTMQRPGELNSAYFLPLSCY